MAEIAIDYKKVFDTLPGNLVLLKNNSPYFTIIAATESYISIAGKDKISLIGTGIFEKYPFIIVAKNNSFVHRLQASLNKVLSDKQEDQLPLDLHDLIFKDSLLKTQYCSIINTPVFDLQGSVQYIIHTLIEPIQNNNLSQQTFQIKAVEQEHALFMQVPVATYIVKGPDLRIEMANETTLQIWNKGKEIIGCPLEEVMPEFIPQGYITLLSKVKNTGEPCYAYNRPVYFIIGEKETLCYFNFIIYPYFDEGIAIPSGVLVVANDVTERVTLKLKLEEKNNISILDSAEFQGLLEAIPHMAWTNLPDGKINFYNQQWTNFTGLNREMLNKAGWETLIHPNDSLIIKNEMAHALATGSNYEVESRYRNTDGQYRWHFVRAIPLKSETGDIYLWVGTATDIHDLKEAEHNLKESELKFRMLIQNTPFPMAVFTGKEMRIEVANKTILDLWGKGMDVIGKLHNDLLPELKIQGISQELSNVFSTGISFEAKNKKVDFYKEGKMQSVYLDYCITPLYDKDEKIYGVLTTGANITQLSLAKQKIEESEERFRTMAESSSIFIKISNENGNATYFNKPWLAFTGRSMEELLNFGWANFVHQNDKANLLYQFAEAFDKKVVFNAEYRMLNNKGEYRWLLTKAPPRFNPDGTFVGYISSSIDITDRKLGEEAVRLSAEKFTLVASAMLQFIWTKDKSGNFQYFNQSIIDYSGLTHQEIKNNGLKAMMHPDEITEAYRQWDIALKKGQLYKYTHRFRRHDGVYRWFLSNNTPQKDAFGNIHTWVGTSTDIQEIKELDEQKDFFIGMVSHELKTPFTTIKGYIQILEIKYGETEDLFLRNSLEIIKKQIGKATTIILDLLDVSKIKLGRLSLNKEYFQLNLLIKEVIEEVQQINNHNRIIFSLPDNAMVYADRGKIGQVVINLLSNALKYSSDDSIVTVQSQIKDNNIIISCIDQGIGIKKDDLEKIFERFYRVEGKDEYKFPGFGIGLFIIAEIIKQHEGKISVSSELGKGSIFHFSLTCV